MVVLAEQLPPLMQGARRNKPPPAALTDAIAYAVGRTYGPGYSFRVRSGIVDEAKGTSGASSSGRHLMDSPGAADVQIFDPEGNQLAGAALTPLGQNWVSNFGSIGINRTASDTDARGWTHMDLTMDQGRGQEATWDYNGWAEKGQREAILSYKRSGKWVDGQPVDDVAMALAEAAQQTREATVRNAPPRTGILVSLFGRGDLGKTRAPIELSPTDRDVAIRTIIGEAASEGPDGQRAVAHVIANRFDQGYGPSVAAIAGDESQFNAWTGDLVTAYNPGDPEYDQVGAIVDEVFTKRPEPPPEVGNATEFYSGKEPRYWGQGAVEKVGQVGRHVFGAIKNAATRPKSFMLRQSRGEESDPRAAALQRQLKQAGVYEGEVDGRYGPQTTKAVKAWQQKNGMRPTGIADGPTLRSLRMPTSDAGFERMFRVNPETPANRAKLFPEDAPRPPKADAIEAAASFDPLEILRDGGGRDSFNGPSISKDRLAPPAGEQISDSGGGDVGRRGIAGDRLGAMPPTPRPNPRRQSAPAAAPAAAAPGGGMGRRIQRGDTFGKLAKQFLGDANRWKEIADANPGVNPRSLQIGSEVQIPGADGPPAPRAKPDTGTVLSDFNPAADSGPSIDTLRELGLTENVFDRAVAADPALNATQPPRSPAETAELRRRASETAAASPFQQERQSRYLANDEMSKRTRMEEAVAGARPQAQPPAGAPRRSTEIFAGADRTGARVERAPPPVDLADVDRRLDQIRNMPSDMNRTGGEAWGESYEEDATLLTDIGLFDARPESGRSPAQLSLDAMGDRPPVDRRVENWARGMEQYRPANQRTPASAAGPTGNAVSPGNDRGAGRRSFIEANRSPTPIDSTTGTWDDLPDPTPKPAPAPAPQASSARRPTGAVITVNGTEYLYDGQDAINALLGTETAAAPATMNYAETASAATPPPVNTAPSQMRKDETLLPPDPVDAIVAAGGSGAAPKTPGAVTPPTSAATAQRTGQPAGGGTVRPYDPGAAPAASSSSGIPSPQNPNFTATGVTVNPVTGKPYAVGTWSNGARAIEGKGWTAVENKDGTFSYAGNPLSNMSLGGL